MTILIFGLVLFLGIHSTQIFAPVARERGIARWGQGRWMLLYTVVAVIGFVLIVVGFRLSRGSTPVLYTPPASLVHLTWVLMIPVFPLLLAAYIKGGIREKVGHPMLIATILWACAHLLSNGTLADVLLFGGFLVWAALDWRSLVARRSEPVATLSPVKTTGWSTNDAIAIIGGLTLYAVTLLGLHRLLIGVSPI